MRKIVLLLAFVTVGQVGSAQHLIELSRRLQPEKAVPVLLQNTAIETSSRDTSIVTKWRLQAVPADTPRGFLDAAANFELDGGPVVVRPNILLSGSYRTGSSSLVILRLHGTQPTTGTKRETKGTSLLLPEASVFAMELHYATTPCWRELGFNGALAVSFKPLGTVDTLLTVNDRSVSVVSLKLGLELMIAGDFLTTYVNYNYCKVTSDAAEFEAEFSPGVSRDYGFVDGGLRAKFANGIAIDFAAILVTEKIRILRGKSDGAIFVMRLGFETNFLKN